MIEVVVVNASLFNFRNFQYIEKDSSEKFYTLKSYPENLMKKVTLLKYFRNYMSEHLLKVGQELFVNLLTLVMHLIDVLLFRDTYLTTSNAVFYIDIYRTQYINFFLSAMHFISNIFQNLIIFQLPKGRS